MGVAVGQAAGAGCIWGAFCAIPEALLGQCLHPNSLIPVLAAFKFFLLGDNMSFSTSNWPTYWELFRDNWCMTLVHEFGFYWSHRLAHHPRLYRYHKVHHEYKQNTILAAQHEHPIDYIVTIATPGLLAISVVAPHSFPLPVVRVAVCGKLRRPLWLLVSLVTCALVLAGWADGPA